MPRNVCSHFFRLHNPDLHLPLAHPLDDAIDDGHAEKHRLHCSRHVIAAARHMPRIQPHHLPVDAFPRPLRVRCRFVLVPFLVVPAARTFSRSTGDLSFPNPPSAQPCRVDATRWTLRCPMRRADATPTRWTNLAVQRVASTRGGLICLSNTQRSYTFV